MLESLGANLYHLDISIFYFFNLDIQNKFLDIIMPLITYAGTPLFWIIICAFLYLFGDEKGKINFKRLFIKFIRKK